MKALVSLLILGFAASGLSSGLTGSAAEPAARRGGRAAAPATIYTCPMHPQIQWTRPDACPICDMKLVAKKNHKQPAGGTSTDHGTMRMEGEAMEGGAMDMEADHGGMSGHDGMDHMMGCGCGMCMEMMHMDGMTGMSHRAAPPASRKTGPARHRYRRASSTRGGCGC